MSTDTRFGANDDPAHVVDLSIVYGGSLIAYDGETGDRIWEFDCGDAALSSSPMSWYDPDTDKQISRSRSAGAVGFDAASVTTASFSADIDSSKCYRVVDTDM